MTRFIFIKAALLILFGDAEKVETFAQRIKYEDPEISEYLLRWAGEYKQL